MSFSGEVKEELSRQIGGARHCQIAELAAMVLMSGSICISEKDAYQIRIRTESGPMAKKFGALIFRLFRVRPEVQVRRKKGKQNLLYTVIVSEDADARKLLQTVKLLNRQGELSEDMPLIHNVILQRLCCKRAFLRGAFLSSGSVSDPNSSYHFEIVCETEYRAEQVRELICAMMFDAKTVQRKKYYVVYVKEGNQIADLLASMGARVALLNMENVRIVREMRGSVNRQVNCETANIHKTVHAAVRQIEDINYIERTIGFKQLPGGLDEMARVRIKYPEASLKELGQLLNPPVGKSGVNHRLRKLSEIAEKVREKREEQFPIGRE